MKVLVTGGAGYIGSHVVNQLTNSGHEVVVLDDLSTGFAESLLNNERLIVGNVGDQELLNELFETENFQGVMHFAGSIIVSESVKDPEKYFKNNTANTLILASTAAKHKIKQFIFSSTAAVYGFGDGRPCSEESKLQPCNPYGLSKLMSEQMLQDLYGPTEIKFGILRYFNVAGADPQGRIGQKTPDATHLIKVCCQVACGERESLEIYGTDYPTSDGTCVRDYIHVEDLASAHLAALKYLDEKKESVILNVGYGRGYSVKEVVERAKKVTGVDFKTKTAPRREGDPATLIAEAEKIKKLLQWQPEFNSLDTIIGDAWRWEKKINVR